MPITIHQVDSFARRPFEGNPAGVCLLDATRDDAWMQNVALEMNLSETAFLERRDDGAFGLRWFTPATEVDLCGHATLASAHVLWETGVVPSDAPIAFETRSGTLRAVRDGEWIELDFPSTPATSTSPTSELLEALGGGVEAISVGRTKFDYLVELKDADAVRAIVPDFGALGRLQVRGVIVTAAVDRDGLDFVSRFFAPAVGVDEDPVTGSAHCALAPFWTERLGARPLLGRQESARGGEVRVELRGDRVALAGSAITVLRAEMVVA